MTSVGEEKEPFGIMSPTRFRFSSQRWRPLPINEQIKVISNYDR